VLQLMNRAILPAVRKSMAARRSGGRRYCDMEDLCWLIMICDQGENKINRMKQNSVRSK